MKFPIVRLGVRARGVVVVVVVVGGGGGGGFWVDASWKLRYVNF